METDSFPAKESIKFRQSNSRKIHGTIEILQARWPDLMQRISKIYDLHIAHSQYSFIRIHK